MRAIAAIVACVLLGACSTIIEGRSQQIAVNTNPAGADCALYRQGLRIATVQNAPGSTLVEKTKHDIWVVCVKQGYQQATYFNHSGAAGATFGNIILGEGLAGSSTAPPVPTTSTTVPSTSRSCLSSPDSRRRRSSCRRPSWELALRRMRRHRNHRPRGCNPRGPADH